jgi:hypothetical protein
MEPGGHVGKGMGLTAEGGDPRNTVGGGSASAELGGAAGGTETISARAPIGPSPKTKASATICSVLTKCSFASNIPQI